MAALIDMAMLVANLCTWGQGRIEDGIGLFGVEPGTTLDADEATEALLALGVDGDLDDLCLAYRHRVAIPLNQRHQFWPVTDP